MPDLSSMLASSTDRYPSLLVVVRGRWLHLASSSFRQSLAQMSRATVFLTLQLGKVTAMSYVRRELVCFGGQVAHYEDLQEGERILPLSVYIRATGTSRDNSPGTSCVSLSLSTPMLHFVGTSPRSSSKAPAGISVLPEFRPKKERNLLRCRLVCSPFCDSKVDAMPTQVAGLCDSSFSKGSSCLWKAAV